jgi:hypothetical protein
MANLKLFAKKCITFAVEKAKALYFDPEGHYCNSLRKDRKKFYIIIIYFQ